MKRITPRLEAFARSAIDPVRALHEFLQHPTDDARTWAKITRAAHEAVSILWSEAELAARQPADRRAS